MARGEVGVTFFVMLDSAEVLGVAGCFSECSRWFAFALAECGAEVFRRTETETVGDFGNGQLRFDNQSFGGSET